MNKKFVALAWIGLSLTWSGCLGGSDSGDGTSGSLTCSGSNGMYGLCSEFAGSSHTETYVRTFCDAATTTGEGAVTFTFSTSPCPETLDGFTRVGVCRFDTGEADELNQYYYGDYGLTVGPIACGPSGGGEWSLETL